MGMRHPARPCMIAGKTNPRKNCGRDRRSPEQIASDPYDTNNPASQAALARKAAGITSFPAPGPNQICFRAEGGNIMSASMVQDCRTCTRFGGKGKCAYKDVRTGREN